MYSDNKKKLEIYLLPTGYLLRTQPGPSNASKLHREVLGGLLVRVALSEKMLSDIKSFFHASFDRWAESIDPVFEAIKIWLHHHVRCCVVEENMPVLVAYFVLQFVEIFQLLR